MAESRGPTAEDVHRLSNEPVRSPAAPVFVPPVVDADSVHGTTSLYIIYLLWRMNVINRYGIKDALEIIKQKTPDDLLTYLIKEVAKI